MIYIFEGPDGSGKSTFCKEFADRNGYPIMHHRAPKPGEDWFKQYMEEISTYGKTGLILDRSWMSDFAYGPVYRPEVELPAHLYDALDNSVVANGGGLVIYCTARPKLLWTRCTKRGESFVKSYTELLQVHENYEKFFRTYRDNGILPVICNVTG